MKRLTTIVLLVAGLLACNLPGAVSEPTTAPQPEATATFPPTDIPPTAPPPTAVPTDAPTQQPTAAPTDEPTATPVTPTNTPSGPQPAEYGEVIYRTNFTAGWPDQEYELGTLVATSNGYVVTAEFAAIWGFTNQSASTDFYTEARARPTTCPDGGSYGLMFHHESNDAWRALAIRCSGGWVLYERTVGEEEETSIASGDLPAAVTPTSGEHRIGVRSEGQSTVLYVDDYPLTELTLDSYPNGRFGIFVETGTADTDSIVLFTNLFVAELTETAEE